MLRSGGMQCLDLLGELAEFGVHAREIRAARLVGPEQLPVRFSQSAGIETRIRRAHDQRAGDRGMPRAELEGDLPPVTPAAHQWAL